MGTIALYPFEYWGLARKRWVRARYVAELDEIGQRHCAFRVLGPPELREAGASDSLTAGHLARGGRSTRE